MRSSSRAGLGAFGMMVLVGQVACAGRCAQEARRTAATLEEAKKARAGIYAPESFEKGEKLAGEADRQCREEEKRFFLFSSYGASDKLHADAREAARHASWEGRINEGMLRQEAMNARYAAIQSVEAAKGSVARTLKVKGGAGVDDLTGSLKRLQEALAALQSRLDRGDYLPARDLGERIVSESTRLQAAANRRTLGLPALPRTDRLY